MYVQLSCDKRIKAIKIEKGDSFGKKITLNKQGRETLPTPVFWPREFLGVYSPWGRKESDKIG